MDIEIRRNNVDHLKQLRWEVLEAKLQFRNTGPKFSYITYVTLMANYNDHVYLQDNTEQRTTKPGQVRSCRCWTWRGGPDHGYNCKRGRRTLIYQEIS